MPNDAEATECSLKPSMYENSDKNWRKMTKSL